MNRDEASETLELSPHASPAERSAQYDTLRRQLEDKLAKAPTPGLREKYRNNLKQLEEAFALLAQTDDSAALPVANKQSAVSHQRSASGTGPAGNLAPQTSHLTPPAARKGSGKEFALVAIIAVVLLGAGGWFVMKTRAENAKQARLTAETKAETDRQAAAAKAEAERKAEEARLAAEAKRQAEETEKNRVAAATKAEQERLETLSTQLRSELAETKIAWDAIEREERLAERQLNELKSDLRSLRDAPAGRQAEFEARVSAQQTYYDWLSGTLARHPAKIFRSRAEQLVTGKQLDLATAAIAELKTALAELESDLPARRKTLLDLEGDLKLETGPEIEWKLTDAFGRSRQGRGPAQLNGLAVGRGILSLRKAGWPERTESFFIQRAAPVEVNVNFRGRPVSITSTPAAAEVWSSDGKKLGTTPLKLVLVPESENAFELRMAGHFPVLKRYAAKADAPAEIACELPPKAEGATNGLGLFFVPMWEGTYYVTTIVPGSAAADSGAFRIGDKVLAFGVPGNLTELAGKPVTDLAGLGTGVVGAPETVRILRQGESTPREISLETRYVSPQESKSLLQTIEEVKSAVRAVGLDPNGSVAVFSPVRAGQTTLAVPAYLDFYAVKKLLDSSRGQLVAFVQIPQNSYWQISWPALALSPQAEANIAARPVNEELIFHPNGTVHLGPGMNKIMKLGQHAAVPVSAWWYKFTLSSPPGAHLNQRVRLVIRRY